MCVVINYANEVRRDWGAALRRARDAKGLTQAVLAEQIGVDPASVSRVEAGLGSLDSTIRIARALGVTTLPVAVAA